MKEVKPSKKPLAIYYAIVLLVLLVINLVVMPWLAERQVQEVDYGTFMSMTEQENIGKVDIQSNQIIFTDKDNKQIYKTVCTMPVRSSPARSWSRVRRCSAFCCGSCCPFCCSASSATR